jgi:hypothetical protein
MIENQNLITFADFEQGVQDTIKKIESDSFGVIQQKLERLSSVFEQAVKMDLFQEEPDTSYGIFRTRQMLGSLVGAVGDRLIELNQPETAEFRAVAERVIKSFDLLSLRLTNFQIGLESFEKLQSDLVN